MAEGRFLTAIGFDEKVPDGGHLIVPYVGSDEFYGMDPDMVLTPTSEAGPLHGALICKGLPTGKRARAGVTVQKGLKSYWFANVWEALFWNRLIRASQRTIRRHGTEKYLTSKSLGRLLTARKAESKEGTESPAVVTPAKKRWSLVRNGYANRAYMGRIPEHFKELMNDPKHGRIVVREALLEFGRRVNWKLPDDFDPAFIDEFAYWASPTSSPTSSPQPNQPP